MIKTLILAFFCSPVIICSQRVFLSKNQSLGREAAHVEEILINGAEMENFRIEAHIIM